MKGLIFNLRRVTREEFKEMLQLGVVKCTRYKIHARSKRYRYVPDYLYEKYMNILKQNS